MSRYGRLEVNRKLVTFEMWGDTGKTENSERKKIDDKYFIKRENEKTGENEWKMKKSGWLIFYHALWWRWDGKEKKEIWKVGGKKRKKMDGENVGCVGKVGW